MKTYEYQIVNTVHQMTEEGRHSWHFVMRLPANSNVGDKFLMERVNEGPDAATLQMKGDVLHVARIMESGHYEPELVVKVLYQIAEGTHERK